MVESKIVSEKQVWIHLIASIKNGLAAATQNKVRRPGVIVYKMTLSTSVTVY